MERVQSSHCALCSSCHRRAQLGALFTDQFQNFQDQRENERTKLRDKAQVAPGIQVAQPSCPSCADSSLPRSVRPCPWVLLSLLLVIPLTYWALTCAVGPLYFPSFACPQAVMSPCLPQNRQLINTYWISMRMTRCIPLIWTAALVLFIKLQFDHCPSFFTASLISYLMSWHVLSLKTEKQLGFFHCKPKKWTPWHQAKRWKI